MTELVAYPPFAVLGLLVGTSIGCVGIGGVLPVPGLVYWVGLEVQIAIATCMFSCLFSGAVGAAEYARGSSIRRCLALWLCVGAMPGAYPGAATVSLMSARRLETFIAGLVLFSGVHALTRRAPEGCGEKQPAAVALALIGGVTGFDSALAARGAARFATDPGLDETAVVDGGGY